MFTEYANLHSEPTAFEYVKTSGIEAKVGLPLKITGGLLVRATGTNKPEYLCMKEGNIPIGKTIPVIPVIPGRKYECVATEAIEAPARGNKYTIAENGSGITATTASGVAMLVGWNGDSIAAGDVVTVQF